MPGETSRLGKLTEDLNQLKDEVNGIESQIRELRRKKADLVQKIGALESRINSQAQDPEELSMWKTKEFPWDKKVKEVLRNVFKLNKFRALQKSAINIALSGEDCLIIMSTGSGKSLCYQLPAVMSNGVTLVVSPLVSLIEDQIIQLNNLGIKAATLNQNSTKQEVKFVHDALGDEKGELRLLYVTPEKLAKSKRIMNRLERCTSLGLLKLIAVDEVHCCSQWGHDFRTDYQFLNILKRQFKGVPIMGLTATATAQVLDDVKSIIGIQAAITLRATFNRENLFYEVRRKPSSNKEMVDEMVNVINGEFPNETGIIYCYSRKECEELARDLKKNGISAAFYHAYVEPENRRHVHERWLTGRYKVIVATLAFGFYKIEHYRFIQKLYLGMGIDKPDVRFVIHHSIAKSMENYYQESGRAGRDGKPAKCILYYKLADLFRQSTSVCTEKTGLPNLYSMLSYAIQKSECRRVCIAEHFDETWDASWCNNMCDNCSTGATTSTREKCDAVDVILSIQKIEYANNQDKLTGKKLLELLMKEPTMKSKTIDVLEEVIAHFLKDGYLIEDFHFTPYSIISYVTLSEKGRRLSDESHVFVDIPTGSQSAPPRKRKKPNPPPEQQPSVKPEIIEINF